MRQRDRVYIDKVDHKCYEILKKREFFKKVSHIKRFIFMMALGFNKNSKIPIKSRYDLFNLKDVKDSENLLFCCLATASSGELFLSEEDDPYSIAEEYARGGLAVFFDSLRHGSILPLLEELVIEAYNEAKNDPWLNEEISSG